MKNIPKPKFNYGAPSTEGDIPPREITDVQPLLSQIDVIVLHVCELWDGAERARATGKLAEAWAALLDFRALDQAHRDRILAELPGRGLVDV